MDIGKILFTLGSIKHKQSDCSLEVNRTSLRMISDSFVSIMNLRRRKYLQVISDSFEPEEKRIFTIYKLFFLQNYVHGEEKGMFYSLSLRSAE